MFVFLIENVFRNSMEVNQYMQYKLYYSKKFK